MVNEAAAAVESSGGIAVLGINLKMFLAQLINFALILVILRFLAYKPLLKILDERAKKIATGMADAESAAIANTLALKEKEALIAKARSEASKIIDEASVKATAVYHETLGKAKDDSEKVAVEAKLKIEHERAQMMSEVVHESKTLLGMAILKIANVKIDETKDIELIRESLKSAK